MIDLKGFRKANNLTQEELGKYLGMKKSFVSKVENGKEKLPQPKLQKLLSNRKGWDTSNLIVDDVYIDRIENNGEINIQAESSKKGNMIPLVPFEAIAGPGTMVFADEQVIDYYEVREFKGADFLIRVKGDSMVPKYNGGDLVACKMVKDMLFFQWGRIYILHTHSQGIMIKRLQPSEKEDCITCVSENPKYAPFEVPKSDIYGVALVCGSISLE